MLPVKEEEKKTNSFLKQMNVSSDINVNEPDASVIQLKIYL